MVQRIVFVVHMHDPSPGIRCSRPGVIRNFTAGRFICSGNAAAAVKSLSFKPRIRRGGCHAKERKVVAFGHSAVDCWRSSKMISDKVPGRGTHVPPQVKPPRRLLKWKTICQMIGAAIGLIAGTNLELQQLIGMPPNLARWTGLLAGGLFGAAIAWGLTGEGIARSCQIVRESCRGRERENCNS
jgi:hypothetical protein